MPIFGKSLFETVLDGIEADLPEEEEEEAAPPRSPRVVAHFLADTSFSEREEERPLGTLYEDFGDPPLPEPELPLSPEPPDWLERLSDLEISEDLGLASGMTRAQIRERRRAFALGNHPDRVAEEFRAPATIRMTVANRLVETALRAV